MNLDKLFKLSVPQISQLCIRVVFTTMIKLVNICTVNIVRELTDLFIKN